MKKAKILSIQCFPISERPLLFGTLPGFTFCPSDEDEYGALME
jgi:hypothetical protein